MNSNCQPEGQGRLGFDFDGPAGVCPQCEADIKDVRTGRFIVKLVIVHYDPPHAKIAGLGMGYPLCDQAGKVSRLHTKGQQASGAPGAVNCPDCLAHADFPHDGIDERRGVADWMLGEQLPSGAGRTPLATKREDKPRVPLGQPQG